ERRRTGGGRVDMDRIAGGGIPLGAEERLRAIAQTDSPVFSSHLSAKEYAVAQASGLQPIAQVMGSSVVQHGWQNYGWGGYGGGIQEMRSFAAPWNLSRTRGCSGSSRSHQRLTAHPGLDGGPRVGCRP
ncbi:MAG: hypothetical protein ACRDK8_03985, partial [Solirubrobacteraceae bacterium]